MGIQQMMLGTGSDPAAGLKLSFVTVSDFRSLGDPLDANVTVLFGSNGVLSYSSSTAGQTNRPDEWGIGLNSANYQVRFTVVNGDTPSGSAVNTWLNLGTTRSVSYNVSSGILSGTILAEIALSGSTTALVSANLTMQASKSQL